MKFTFAVVIVAVMATLAVAAPVEEGKLMIEMWPVEQELYTDSITPFLFPSSHRRQAWFLPTR